MSYKEIKMFEAVNLAMTGQEVYMLQRITSDTTIDTLSSAKGFVLKTAADEVPVKKAAQKEKKEAPRKEESQTDGASKAIDHGKIVALYTATPPALFPGLQTRWDAPHRLSSTT